MLALLGLGLIAMLAGYLGSPYSGELAIWLVWPLGTAAWLVWLAFIGPEERAGGGSAGSPFGRDMLPLVVGLAGTLLCVVSLLDWAAAQGVRLEALRATGAVLPSNGLEWLAWWFSSRNHQPLGHVNYTGGSAVLFLPWLMWLAWRAWSTARGRGIAAGAMGTPSLGEFSSFGATSSLACCPSRSFLRLEALFWTLSVVFCLAMLVSSGSRGAWLATLFMLVLLVGILARSRPEWRSRLIRVGLIAVGIVVGLAFVLPTLRSSLRPREAAEIPNASNAERRSMLSVGWRMGLDRPIVGWGIGAVPLVYDRFRGQEVYGPVNMLQVHSTPMNLWAEGGAALVLAAAGLLVLAGRTLWRRSACAHPGFIDLPLLPAGVSLLGYAAFSLTDYQLDLPLIAMMVATNLGVLVSVEVRPASGRFRFGVSLVSTAVLICGLWMAWPWLSARHALSCGEVDRAVDLLPNDSALRVLRALRRTELARGTAESDRQAVLLAGAEADLNSALSNGAQAGVAHFNLGWVLLDRRPAEALAHFDAVLAVAASYPNAWLGRGLAAATLGRHDEAVDAFAMECLVQPAFLYSGWWGCPVMAPVRGAVLDRLRAKLAAVARAGSAGAWPEPQARYFAVVIEWIQRRASPAAVGQVALDGVQRAFWCGLDTGETAAGADAVPLLTGLRREPGTRERLVLHLERTAGFMAGAQADRFLAVFADSPPAAVALRRLWYGGAGPQPRALVVYPQSIGFGVRMRTPAAQYARHCSPVFHNPAAEVLTSGLLPPPGWLYDDRIRALVVCR